MAVRAVKCALLAAAAAAIAMVWPVAAGASTPSCARPSPYPPSTGAVVSVSTSTPQVGQDIRVSGSGFCADEALTLTVHGSWAAALRTDGQGRFVTSLRAQPPAGRQSVCASGASGLAVDRACTAISVATLGVDAVATGPHLIGGTPLSTSSPALTGARVAELVTLSALLLGPGTVVALLGRRRRLSARP